MDKWLNGERSEQGAALVMSIITLFIITALATAMLASARTEYLIAINEERSVLARAAAEAGLNRAVQVLGDRLTNWRSISPAFADAQAAVTDLLDGPDDTAGNADDGLLTEYGFTVPGSKIILSSSLGTSYEVRVYDDDDMAAPRLLSLGTADFTRMGENNNITSDLNRRLIVHAIGYGPGSTTTSLEAVLGPMMLPAVMTNANLTVNGTVTIQGAYGSIHTNNNLIMTGGSADISQNCTSSGTITGSTSNCDGNVGAGRPPLEVPNVWAADYLSLADFVLTSSGRIEFPDGSLKCNAPCDNWTFTSGSPGTWSFSDDPTNGTYYVQGNVVISGSPGTDAVPVQVTLLAEGYVDISGSPDLAPRLPELFMVTNMDLKVIGTLDAIEVEGQVLVREQMDIAGNIDFAGQLIAQDATSTCTLVTDNSISGSVTITYNGSAGSSNFSVLSWRDVR